MLGLLVIIVVSWVLLHFIEKKNIEVLGIIPYGKRIAQFFIGMVFVMLITLLSIYIETLVLKVDWKMQSSINYQSIFDAFVYHIRSALTEDLVFRGAILYMLINRLGAKWGILISALCFGVYHVFSYGMTGASVIPILYVVLVTGFVGYVWAYTFHKTKSIILALGFHVGVNIISAFFFESQPYGELIFKATTKLQLIDWNWLYFNLFKGLFPGIMMLLFVKLVMRYNSNIFKPTQLIESNEDII